MKRSALVLVAALAISAGGFMWGRPQGLSAGVPVASVGSEGDAFSELPDRIGVTDRQGEQVVGTVARSDLQRRAQGDNSPLEVRDPGGEVVGHLVPMIGFVSLEESSSPGYDEAKLRSESPVTTVIGGGVPK